MSLKEAAGRLTTKPLFPNNPDSFSQRRSPSIPSAADVFILKGRLLKMPQFLSFCLPRSTNQKMTVVGSFLMLLDSHVLLFPTLCSVIFSSYFEYLCGCATFPTFALDIYTSLPSSGGPTELLKNILLKNIMFFLISLFKKTWIPNLNVCSGNHVKHKDLF